VRLADGALVAVCDRVIAGGLLAVLLLLPVTFFPYAASAFAVPKAALLQSLTVLIIVAGLMKLLAGRSMALRRSPLDLPIAAYLGIVLVGFLRASSRDAALFGVGGRSDGLLTLLGAVALYFVAYHLPAGPGMLRRGLACLSIGAGLAAAEGIAETLGFSMVVGFDPAAWGGRAYSTTGNPNFLGSLLALALPLPLGLLLVTVLATLIPAVRAVRVNPPATPWFADDVADVVAAGADALVIGHVDLSRTLGIREAGATEGTILHARCHLVLAAKAAGRQAVDAVFMDLDDPDGLTAEARQGLRLGFTGKLVIDERQVALVHAAFRPSEAEVAYARRLVAAWDAAVAAGTGVFVFEGRVIDRPVVEAERTILARAALP